MADDEIRVGALLVQPIQHPRNRLAPGHALRVMVAQRLGAPVALLERVRARRDDRPALVAGMGQRQKLDTRLSLERLRDVDELRGKILVKEKDPHAAPDRVRPS